MFAIGQVTCVEHDESKIRVEIMLPQPNPPPYEDRPPVERPIAFCIGNYDRYRLTLDKLMRDNIWGYGHGCALFSFDPQDQFAYYVPMDKIQEVS